MENRYHNLCRRCVIWKGATLTGKKLRHPLTSTTFLIVVVVAAHSSSCSPGTHLHRQIDRQAPIKQTPITTTKGSRQPKAGRGPRAPINKHRPQPPNQTHPSAGRSHRAPQEKHQPATSNKGQMPTTATKKKRGTTEGQNQQTKNKIDISTWAEPQSAKGQTPTTNHSHSEKKTNTPGRAEAPGSPEHQITNTRHNHQKKDTPGRAEATGHQKRNTNSSDQHQRTKNNRSCQHE